MPTEKQRRANAQSGKATRFRSGDEAAKNGKKGGKASGEARRKLKSFRELDTEFTTDEERREMLETLKLKARRGNLKAFEIYRDTMGMNPKDQTAITTEYADDGLTGALEKTAAKVWKDE